MIKSFKIIIEVEMINQDIKPHIIIADMYYPQTHSYLNNEWIRIISGFAKVTIVDDGKLFDSVEFSEPNYQRIKVKPIFTKHFNLLELILHIFNLIVIAWKVRKINYTKLFFLTVHNDALIYALPLFKKNRVVCAHHNDLDGLMYRNTSKKHFKEKAHLLKHVVLADFIRDGLLKEFPELKKEVFVVNEPLQYYSEKSVRKEKMVVSMGRDNDISLIENLINYDSQHEFKSSYNFLIRSRKVNYVGNNIEVTSRYFSRDEFDDIQDTASVALLLYPQSYNLRYSGIIDDALSHHLIVLSTDFPMARYYNSLMPNNVRIIKNVIDVFNLVDTESFLFDNEELQIFLDLHKRSSVERQLKQVLLSN